MTDLQTTLLKLFAKASSQRPMPGNDALNAALRQHPESNPAALKNALADLVDRRVLATIRHSKDGITRDLYWPTGLRNALTQGTPMTTKRPESGSSNLLRNIVAHGPIIGADLAAKTGIAAKSIDVILNAPNTRDVIVTRKGFCIEKGRELKHYMTRIQAEHWDAREAAAEQELIDAVAHEPDQDEHATHVMSAPASTKHSEAENPVNETATENAELAEAQRTVETLRDNLTGMLSDWTDIRCALDVATHEEALMAIAQLNDTAARDDKLIHDLRNDVYAAHLVLSQIGKKLAVGDFTAIPAALDELTHALATRALQSEQPTGRLALLLIDSDDMTDVEELNACDIRIAQAAAMARIDHGHAARAVVVRVLGEALRRVEWKEAA